MTDFPPADHAMGLELQLEELIEQRRRAVVQGRDDDAQRLESEVDRLQADLAVAAEAAAGSPHSATFSPEVHGAHELDITEEPE
ncbi:MAG: hypothetical protein ACR2MN_01555 [Acidimicrobiales bacterium]